MRTARLQTNDLGRADHFFSALLSKENVKETDKASIAELPGAAQVNGGSLSMRDSKPRFSDPPAPPPQQPLPEKPDVARSHNVDPSPPSLKRSNTERARSVPSVSPIRQEPTSQILSLVEALASAKKEIDTQSARMRDLEEMLQKERQARELAEEVAKRLELQSSEPKINGFAKASSVSSVIEEAFEPPCEIPEPTSGDESDKSTVDAKSISASTLLLEQRLETMVAEMQQMKNQMESVKHRAETAETERDTDRKTLVEMVEKIRTDQSARRSSSTERTSSPDHKADSNTSNTVVPLPEKPGLANGKLVGFSEETKSDSPTTGILTKSPSGHDPLSYHATPYASMLGVVLLGMGLMAYMNGWQPPKVDQ
jgi:hypothetical protein